MTPELLVEYEKRFSSKNWAKIDAGKKVEYLFDRISLLDDDNQKNLILDLTDKFEYVEILNFVMELKETLEECVRKNIQSKKLNVLLAPLKAPFIDLKKLKKSPDGSLLFSKSKSPDMVYLLLKNYLTDEALFDTIKFCDEPSFVAKKYKSVNSVIVLVDDFVGTGQTAKTHIGAYINLLKQYNLQCTYSDFCVVVDIAMKQGVDYLSTLGTECYFKRLRVRGISDNEHFSADQIQVNINLMKQIENKLFVNLKSQYSLGFCQTESLVSILNKAPNNTFPFYWEKCIGDVKPVFRRYYE